MPDKNSILFLTSSLFMIMAVALSNKEEFILKEIKGLVKLLISPLLIVIASLFSSIFFEKSMEI